MNTKEMATLIEEELQHHIHISIKSAKVDHAVFEVEDDEGNSFVLRLSHVKAADEDVEDDDEVHEINLDHDD